MPAGPRGRRPARRRNDPAPARPTGLNENYARELLELHTLGVEVARAFTGWTVMPPAAWDRGRRRPDFAQAARFGFVADDGFLFHPGFHDAEKKTILGQRFPAGAGIEEGERVLDLVAMHPSTASFLSRKLAVRFVADDPSEELVSRLATVFRSTGGDLSEVVRALARSPEFWSAEARRAKIKSPFEVAASSLRALGATLQRAQDLASWIERMGQPLYRYEAPTGYPDRAETWVNSGSLLVRMNFGLELASGGVRGVRLPPASGDAVPGSRLDLLEAVARRLLPGRDVATVVAPLESQLAVAEDLPRAVGLVLGSPEFQRR